MPMRAHYTGKRSEDGAPVEYLTGIPARNLDEDEYQALSADQRKAVRDSGLYAVKTDADMKPADKAVRDG